MASGHQQPPTPLGTVLVTGGCGFLGSHIVARILARYPANSTKVHVLDLRTTSNLHDGVDYHAADLTSSDAVRAVLHKVKPSVVIHTASPVAAGNDSSSAARKKVEQLFYRVNVEGTRTLIEESVAAGVRAFVYTSSASVISDTKTDLVNADERYPLCRRPFQLEYYSDTKAEAEQLVLSSNAPFPTAYSASFLTTAVRPSAIFGEGDVQMIPNMLNVVRTRRTAWQLGANDNLFDFTYVGNVAHAHVLAAERLLETYSNLQVLGKKTAKSSPAMPQRDPADLAAKVDGEAFVITNASPVYFWDFARAVWTSYSRLSGDLYAPVTPLHKVKTLPFGLAVFFATLASWIFWLFHLGKPSLTPPQVRYSCMTRYFKPTKAFLRLGYAPIVGLDDAVNRTVEWFWEREKAEAAKKGQ